MRELALHHPLAYVLLTWAPALMLGAVFTGAVLLVLVRGIERLPLAVWLRTARELRCASLGCLDHASFYVQRRPGIRLRDRYCWKHALVCQAKLVLSGELDADVLDRFLDHPRRNTRRADMPLGLELPPAGGFRARRSI